MLPGIIIINSSKYCIYYEIKNCENRQKYTYIMSFVAHSSAQNF